MRRILLSTLSIIPFLWGCQANSDSARFNNSRIERLMPSAGGDTTDNKDFEKINCTKREVSVAAWKSKSGKEEWNSFESMPDRDWFFTYLYDKYCG